MKRFTDTNIWRKVWFQELSPEYKAAWFYIKDNCDSIGIWDVNIPLANFQIGNNLDWDKFRDCCNENIQVLSEKKWWLVDFCNFQYGKLDENSKSPPIISYVKLLKKYNLYELVTDRQSNMGIGKGHNISPSTRAFVIKRDDHICAYCNKKLSNFDLVLDHVVPRIKGGKDEPDNLVVACKKCNNYKGSLDLLDYVKKHSLDKTVIQRVSERVSVTLKEKDKDKDKDKEKEKEPKKHKYGEYHHVLLTDKEYETLPIKVDNREKWINRLDDYLQMHKKKHYDDHNLTMQNWYRNDEDKQPIKIPVYVSEEELTEDEIKEGSEILAAAGGLNGMMQDLTKSKSFRNKAKTTEQIKKEIEDENNRNN